MNWLSGDDKLINIQPMPLKMWTLLSRKQNFHLRWLGQFFIACNTLFQSDYSLVELVMAKTQENLSMLWTKDGSQFWCCLFLLSPLAIFSLYHFRRWNWRGNLWIIKAWSYLNLMKFLLIFHPKRLHHLKNKWFFWYQTKPYQTRADQNIVYRLLSILAARSKEKLDSLQIEK